MGWDLGFGIWVGLGFGIGMGFWQMGWDMGWDGIGDSPIPFNMGGKYNHESITMDITKNSAFVSSPIMLISVALKYL
ncbi:hypothetical protein RhiirC2_794255 [Rhizophagus irregularis]|uniref:Uncharacterized protein n=1 Tax=Rhizophagus irregularis TaxID=588596 RepID=A0A2N1ME40_9GLOM|nr:hypothetical protein RhiirC2_794255 [Rhizophagus irregularis]